MSKIIVNSNFSQIINDDDLEFLSKLNKHLSFKYIGAEFTPAFKAHRWDGKAYLLSKNLSFMTGLLDRVKDFYKDNNRELEIIDERGIFIPGNEIDLTKKLIELGITPYDYQIEAVKIAINNERVMFKHATGSGKSLTAAMITAKFGLPSIIWVIGLDLLYQFHSLFSKLFDCKIGMIGDGVCDIGNINIVSIWTAGKALGLKKQEMFLDDVQDEKYQPTDCEKILKVINDAKIHHFDEAHICAASTIRTIYKYSNPQKILGYSGSPIRDDGADLMIEGIFGNIVHEVKASDLIKKGILAKPYIKFLYIKSKSHYKDTYNKVYSDNVINNNYRNNLIVSETKKLLDKNYKVLILFKNIAHGIILKKLFDDKNIDVEFLTGKDKTDKREKAKDNFLSGKSNCCLVSMIFDIGINLENITGLVLTGSGKSSVKTLQRLGRALRNGKEKYNGIACLEFFDDCKYLKKHALIRKSIYETEPEFEIYMPKEFDKK